MAGPVVTCNACLSLCPSVTAYSACTSIGMVTGQWQDAAVASLYVLARWLASVLTRKVNALCE